MFATLGRSAYISATTISFGLLGGEMGESVDRLCHQNDYFCSNSENKHFGEMIGTISGAYVGLLTGVAILAVDLYLESKKTPKG